jgi:wyosine [tRNA(Phe)-imidazoG37] synthetase (radical SAM superfamily)
MSTFLFDKTIFGPVKSRRLGVSLGINLLPNTRKVCNFNCIYCECGWNPNIKNTEKLPTLSEVETQLESKLADMKAKNEPLDVITFAGNGEPTMHPKFAEIIDITCRLRDTYFPNVKVAVLSNATLVFKPSIVNALKKTDQNILKIDSAFEDTCRLLNNPVSNFNLNEIINGLQQFHGKLTIQTMFVKGSYEGVNFDNSTDLEVEAWLQIIKKIKPLQVMIYTIARDTPIDTIYKVPASRLKQIAEKLKKEGFSASISE